MSLSHSRRSSLAKLAAILFVPVAIAVGVQRLGGWSEIPDLLAALAVMSIVGIFVVSVSLVALTLGAAIVGLGTYVALAPFTSEPDPSDSPQLSTRAASIVLAVLVLIATLWITWLTVQKRSGEALDAARETEKEQVVLFVQNHPGVLARVGGAVTASVFSTSVRPSHMPEKYTLYISGTKIGLLEVRPQRSSTPVAFRLGCLRPSSSDPAKVFEPICDWESPIETH